PSRLGWFGDRSVRLPASRCTAAPAPEWNRPASPVRISGAGTGREGYPSRDHMSPHFGLNRRLMGVLDPDLVGLPPAFAARVHLHRRGWSTHQASINAGRTLVACAERDGHRIRCEGDEPSDAWWQVLDTAISTDSPAARA